MMHCGLAFKKSILKMIDPSFRVFFNSYGLWLVSLYQANMEQREGVQILMQAVKYIQLRSISHSKLMKVPPSSQHCVVHSYFVKPT